MARWRLADCLKFARELYMRTRAALSLLELLAVLAIIGLLLAILLPAILAAREKSRRVQCASHLRQITLAVHAYEQAQHALPALYNGPVKQASPYIGAFYLHSWQSLILPHIEEENLFRRLDFSKLAPHADNEPAVSSPVHLYVCPSSSRSQGLLDYYTTPPPWATPPNTTLAAVTDYQATPAVQWRLPPDNTPHNVLHFGAWGEPSGQFGDSNGYASCVTRKLRLADIRDGTTHTTLICEAAGRPDHIRRGKPTIPFSLEDGYQGPDASTWAVSAGFHFYVIAQFDSTGGVNQSNFHETFYSFHPGGAHVAHCDGSVHFLAEDTDIATLQRCITRDRGD
jgi:competence protein ComGC